MRAYCARTAHSIAAAGVVLSARAADFDGTARAGAERMVASLAGVSGRVRLAFAVGILGAASCSDNADTGSVGGDATALSTAPDAATLRRLLAIRARFGAVVQGGSVEELAVHGSRVIPRARNSVHGAATLGVELPLRADGALRLTEPRSQVGVEVSLRGTQAVRAETDDGLLIFAGALAGADVIHRPSAEQVEDFVVFEREAPASELRYELVLNERTAHVRLLHRTLELLDSDGAPRLAMVPPYAVDRLGERHDVQVALEGCAYDADPRDPRGRTLPAPGSRRCELRLAWERGLEHPLLIDPAWVNTQNVSFPARTLTKLPDGRVLVSGNTRQAALYSAGSGTWATTGTMLVAREKPAAALLADGRVGVFGGSGTCSSNTVEFYSASTGTWAAGSQHVGWPLGAFGNDGRLEGVDRGGRHDLRRRRWLAVLRALRSRRDQYPIRLPPRGWQRRAGNPGARCDAAALWTRAGDGRLLQQHAEQYLQEPRVHHRSGGSELRPDDSNAERARFSFDRGARERQGSDQWRATETPEAPAPRSRSLRALSTTLQAPPGRPVQTWGSGPTTSRWACPRANIC
jgi:hypothetical protein